MRNNLFFLLNTILLLSTISCNRHSDKYNVSSKNSNPKSLKSLAFLSRSNPSNGNNLFHEFVLNNYYHDHILLECIESIECQKRSELLQTILGCLLSNNDRDENTIRLLMNEHNHKGYTPLHLAVLKNSSYIVEMLRDAFDLTTIHIDVNIKSKEGDTPLHLAVKHGYKRVVKSLMEYKYIDVNKKNNFNKTPLHIAVLTDNLESVSELINHGANINEKDNDGRTPLHIAAEYNSLEVVKLLLEHTNIEINSKDNRGRTAFDLAKDKRIIDLL